MNRSGWILSSLIIAGVVAVSAAAIVRFREVFVRRPVSGSE